MKGLWLRASVVILCALSASAAPAATRDHIPNFSPQAGVAWQSDTQQGLEASASGPQPVGVDPAIFGKDNPYDMDTAFPVLDIANPNLQPWVAEALGAQNARVLAGEPLQPRSSSCWPHGVPAFMRFNGPTFIIQGADEVVILKNQRSDVRRVALNRPHSVPPNPSWYGDSVGHYENGETLVIDTIGFNDKTHVDLFRTPHSSQLHVIERWTLTGDGREMELKVYVEDPVAFKAPYELTKRYRRVEAAWIEAICAENPIGPLHQGLEPMPQADTPDF